MQRKDLLPKLENCSIGVIGLGYVGLPLAITIAKQKKCFLTKAEIQRKVIGFDLNEARINELENGFVEATILITPKGNIHNKPLLTFKGLPIYEKEEFQYGLEEEIEKTTKTFSMNNKKQEINLIEALKSTCRKYTKEKTGKRPLTNINLVRI